MQAILLQKVSSLFSDQSEEVKFQKALDKLALKKLSWESFLKLVPDPLSFSRYVATGSGRTLLHLAVIDDRTELIELLKNQPVLRLKKDALGLTPLELAQFLDRKRAAQILGALDQSLNIPSLPKTAYFEYLNHPIFETEEEFEEVVGIVAKAKREDKIPPEKIWMGIYFDTEVRKAVHPFISIREVNRDVGFGVFADKKIAACTFVGEYTGVIVQKKTSQLKKKFYCLRYTTWDGKNQFVIDAERKGNFTRFINHSSEPNLGVQTIYWQGIPRMIFVSLKEIQEGDQLTFDYGPLFWKQAHQTPQVV